MSRSWHIGAVLTGLALAGCAEQSVTAPPVRSIPASAFDVFQTVPGEVYVCPNGPPGTYGYTVTVAIAPTWTIGAYSGTFSAADLAQAQANQTLFASPVYAAGSCTLVFKINQAMDIPSGGGFGFDPVRQVTVQQTAAPAGTQLDSIVAVDRFSGTRSVLAPASTIDVSLNDYRGASTSFFNSLVPQPHLSITKTGDATPVTQGGTVGFKMTVSNAGPGAASNVTLSDALPTGLAWVVAGDSDPTCTISSGTLGCSFGTLAAGASTSAHVTAVTNNDLCGTYTNPYATVSASNHATISSSGASVAVSGCVNITAALCTATQGGWGQKASGQNIGKLRDTYFATVYPTGLLVGSATRYIKLTTAKAVEDYLPATKTPAALTQSYTNPLTTTAGVFGGQVTTLKLSVGFSAANVTGWATGLGSATLTSGPMAGKTVAQVLAAAETALAGGALPAGMTISQLNDVVDAINNSQDGCKAVTGLLKR